MSKNNLTNKYEKTTYVDFESLKNKNINLANSLDNLCRPGYWKNNEIVVFETLDDYVKYELVDGFYSDMFEALKEKPNPLKYAIVDLDKLGLELLKANKFNVVKANGFIVYSRFGFYRH